MSSINPTTPTNTAALPQEHMLASVAAQQHIMMAKMQEAMQAFADNQSAKDKTIEDLKEQLTRTQAALTASQEMNTKLMNIHKVETQALRDQITVVKQNAREEISAVKTICARLENRYHAIERALNKGYRDSRAFPKFDRNPWLENGMLQHEKIKQVQVQFDRNNEAYAKEVVEGMKTANVRLNRVETLLK